MLDFKQACLYISAIRYEKFHELNFSQMATTRLPGYIRFEVIFLDKKKSFHSSIEMKLRRQLASRLNT